MRLRLTLVESFRRAAHQHDKNDEEQEPAVANQTVTFTTAVQSSAFNANTKFIRLIADAECHLLFGADPTATASHQMVPVDTEIWRMVVPGQKVSVYDGTSS
jgi:hypothetical protein